MSIFTFFAERMLSLFVPKAPNETASLLSEGGTGPSGSGLGSFFEAAQNLAIRGGYFNNVRGDLVINLNKNPTLQNPCPNQNENTSQTSTLHEEQPRSSENLTSSQLPVQQSSIIYQRHLEVKGRGFPLWIPPPDQNLPTQYRRTGVRVGDVGIITPDGGFSFLFNVCLPHDDPVNPRLLPEYFSPISPLLEATDIDKFLVFGHGSHLASSSTGKAQATSQFSGFQFESSAPQGAILTMPLGATSENLRNIARFRRYIASNIIYWYKFVNGVLDRGAGNGDIRVVVGCDKTMSWGIATFANQSRQSSCRLRFGPPTSAPTPSDNSRYVWEYSGIADVRAGPSPGEENELGQINDPGDVAYENQCVFLRTLNTTLPDDIWSEMQCDLGSGDLQLRGDFHPTQDSAPTASSNNRTSASTMTKNGPSTSSNMLGNHRSPGPHSEAQNDIISLGGNPALFDSEPLSALVPAARMVITHDDNWSSVASKYDKLPSPLGLLAQILVSHCICEENGVVFLDQREETQNNGQETALGTLGAKTLSFSQGQLLQPSYEIPLPCPTTPSSSVSDGKRSSKSSLDCSITHQSLSFASEYDAKPNDGMVSLPHHVEESAESATFVIQSPDDKVPIAMISEGSRTTWDPDTTDIIKDVLNIMAIPCLRAALASFISIWKLLGQVQTCQEQLRVLAINTVTFLMTLSTQYGNGKLSDESTVLAIEDLDRLLNEIKVFMEGLNPMNFVELLFRRSQTVTKIDDYQLRIKALSRVFEISDVVDIYDWKGRNERAREADHKYLCSRLEQLVANQPTLAATLNVGKLNQMAMMATLKKRIDNKKGEQEELAFFTEIFQYLLTTSGRQVDVKPWTISRFDVEFGDVIGRGGFGEVYRGSWNQTEVALKVIKNNVNIVPCPEAVLREVETWSKLRHPHILQFFGANILDDKPFIVMPLIVNGNAHDYINRKPKCDRLRLIKQVALGLVYLHSQDVVHGDLKGVNILVDDGEKALLCDFGLSRIKADINSRSMSSSPHLVGSPNWMAPELFKGENLRFPCDVYSFGITMHELFTNEIPLGHLSPHLLHTLVVHQNMRPGRPNMIEAPQLSDEAWAIMQLCWEAEPTRRPTAGVVSNKLKSVLSMYPLVDPSNSHSKKSPSMSVRSLPAEAFEVISREVSPIVPKPTQLRTSGRIFLGFLRMKLLPMVKKYFTSLTLENPGSVTSLVQSSDGKVLTTGLSDGSCIMWHISVAKIALQLEVTEHPHDRVTAVKFEPLTWTYAAGFKSGQILYHHRPLSLFHSPSTLMLEGNDEPIVSLHVLNIVVMALICPGNCDPTIIKWCLSLHGSTSTIVERLPLSGIAPSSCRCTAFSPNGKEIYIGTSDGSLFVFYTSNGQSAHGPFHLSSASQDNTLSSGGAASPDRDSAGVECRSLAICPSSKKIMVSYSSGEIRLWDIKARHYSVLRDAVTSRVSNINSPAYSSMPITFAHDGSYVAYASATDPQAVEIQDVLSKKMLSRIVLEDFSADGIQSLDISPNNKRLIVTFRNSRRVMVYVWN